MARVAWRTTEGASSVRLTVQTPQGVKAINAWTLAPLLTAQEFTSPSGTFIKFNRGRNDTSAKQVTFKLQMLDAQKKQIGQSKTIKYILPGVKSVKITPASLFESIQEQIDFITKQLRTMLLSQ